MSSLDFCTFEVRGQNFICVAVFDRENTGDMIVYAKVDIMADWLSPLYIHYFSLSTFQECFQSLSFSLKSLKIRLQWTPETMTVSADCLRLFVLLNLCLLCPNLSFFVHMALPTHCN